jgi:hypothetical protein
VSSYDKLNIKTSWMDLHYVRRMTGSENSLKLRKNMQVELLYNCVKGSEKFQS